MPRLGDLVAQLGSLARERTGATAIATALMSVVVLGFVGFGIDFGSAYTSRRAAQNAADSAAFSAAVAQYAGAADVAAEAKAIAASYGLVDGQNGVSITVNTPPATGPHVTDTSAVEVIVARPGPQFFSRLFDASAFTIHARAVGTTQLGQNGDGCVLALDPVDSSTITMNGSGDLDLNGCALDDNSSNAQALQMNGTFSVTASAVNVVGGIHRNGVTSITVPDPSDIRTGAKKASDPYADVPVPTPPSGGSCTQTVVNGGSKAVEFTPVNGQYVFCGGLLINGSGTVKFDPGVYFIKNGSFSVNGTPTITGSGVSFVLVGDTAGQIGSVNINGGASIVLSAPADGATAGLLFFQDGHASQSGTDSFNGGSAQNFTGALYFPSQSVTFNGSNQVAGAGCTQLVASKITFNGTPKFGNNCQGTGVRGIGGSDTVLVE
jgi:hypothetical protein